MTRQGGRTIQVYLRPGTSGPFVFGGLVVVWCCGAVVCVLVLCVRSHVKRKTGSLCRIYAHVFVSVCVSMLYPLNENLQQQFPSTPQKKSLFKIAIAYF